MYLNCTIIKVKTGRNDLKYLTIVAGFKLLSIYLSENLVKSFYYSAIKLIVR